MPTLKGASIRMQAAIKSLRGVPPMMFPTAVNAYYPQQPSCQVPNLFFLFEQYLGRRESGLFVEVGAFDGVFASNSWGLAVRGWSGLMIEPVPAYAATCREAHASHPQVRVIERAVGAVDDASITLHLAGTLTTASNDTFDEYATVDWASASRTAVTVAVQSQRLDSLLAESSVEPGFDVLIVDVEGFETEVFAGFDIERWRPAMQIVELADSHPDLTVSRDEHAHLARSITEHGYTIVYKDAINTVFVRNDLWAAAHRRR